MADTEHVQSPAPFSTWLGVVLLFALFGVIALAIIGPAQRGDTYERQRAENRLKKLKDAREEDAKALTGYAWIDKNKGTVRLPVERAMELSVVELANKKPVPAGPIATPIALAAPGGAAALPAAPSASAQASETPKPTAVVSPQLSPAAPAVSPSPAASIAPSGSPLPVRSATATPAQQ